MQRKLCGKPVYLSGRNKSDREFIYLHMSNHYRRIVNAKKAIDNSPPSCFKGKRPCTSNPGIPKNKVNRHFESLLLTDRSLSTNSNKDSWGTDSFTCGSRYHARCVPDASPNMTSPKLGDMDLIERITYDTKHGPSSYSEKCWPKPKEHSEKRIVLKENKSEVKQSAGKRSLSNAGQSERTQKRKLSSQVIYSPFEGGRFSACEREITSVSVDAAGQKVLKSSEVPAKGTKSTPSVREKLSAKVLKRPAVSKLRSLRVYHPPRRVKSRPKTANSRSYCKCTKICLCDESASKKMTLNPKEHSVTSSRDSAYNGGISSVPESRSPTPDHRSKKDCCCCCCERMQRASMLFPKERSNTTTPRATTPRATTPRTTTPRARSPRSRSPRARCNTPKSDVRPKSATGPRPVMCLKSATGLKSAMGPKSAAGPKSSKLLKPSIKIPNSSSDTSLPKSRSKSPERDPYEKMQDDALYVAFVQDITTEVLEKNLYTNKALKNVMKKHLQMNLEKLDKDRMLQELEHLRMQLGIPEDQSLFDSAAETVDSATDITKCNYPVISDSEFSFPVEDIMPLEKTNSLDGEKISECANSPEKTKPEPPEETKSTEEATCIFIKPSVDPTVLQATRLNATREPSLSVQTKTACGQPCGLVTPCCQTIPQSSGLALCFVPQSSGQTTPSFAPQSPGQTTPSFAPQSSGQTTPSFLQQPSAQTPPFTPQSSAQTPSFTSEASVVFAPTFMQQRSRQAKSLESSVSRQPTHPSQSPNQPTSSAPAKSLMQAPSTQVAPSLQTPSSMKTATSITTTPSIMTAPSFLPPTTMQTKIFLKQTTSRRVTAVHPEVMPAVESRGKLSISTETFRKKSEKSTSVLDNPKNSSETDNEISGIPKKKSPRDRRREESILKNSTARSRDISSEDSDRPSEPKKRSYGKTRRQKFPKRYPTSSSDSEMSACYSRTLVKDNRKVPISKDTYSAGSSTPTHVRKKSRSVSFWRNPEYKAYHGPKIKTRKAVASHSEESFVSGCKKSPKCE